MIWLNAEFFKQLFFWQDYCLKELTKKFPSSLRVERLKGRAKAKGDLMEEKRTFRLGIEKESLADWKEANIGHEVCARERERERESDRVHVSPRESQAEKIYQKILAAKPEAAAVAACLRLPAAVAKCLCHGFCLVQDTVTHKRLIAMRSPKPLPSFFLSWCAFRLEVQAERQSP